MIMRALGVWQLDTWSGSIIGDASRQAGAKGKAAARIADRQSLRAGVRQRRRGQFPLF
jgi:hypothetical protein